MSVHKIQCIYTVVNNMDAMQAFYTRLLGHEAQFRDNDRWTQFGVGGTHFALSSATEAAPGADGSVVVFETTDIDGMRESVERAGGRFLSERDMGSHGKVLAFTDPEGHAIQVFTKNAQQPQ